MSRANRVTVSLSDKWARASMCSGKACMSAPRAYKVAKRMTRKHKAKVEAYRCPMCGRYHVGGKIQND